MSHRFSERLQIADYLGCVAFSPEGRSVRPPFVFPCTVEAVRGSWYSYLEGRTLRLDEDFCTWLEVSSPTADFVSTATGLGVSFLFLRDCDTMG